LLRCDHSRPLLRFAVGIVGILLAGAASAQPSPTLDDVLCVSGKPAAGVGRSLRFTH
jgi:hypothetical protein